MKLTKTITKVALTSSILCVLCPFSIYIGVIPISLASFIICLIGVTLGANYGVLSTCVYLFIGLVGLPVFASFLGGFNVLTGVTGGFLFGYILVSLISGLFTKFINNKPMLFLGFLLCHLVLYLVGSLWYSFITSSNFWVGLSVCVLPFLVGDFIKIIILTFISKILKNSIENA